MRYMAINERGTSSRGAYVPDLPGCVAVGETRDELVRLIQGAVRLHVEDLKRRGVLVLKPTADGVFVDVEAA